MKIAKLFRHGGSQAVRLPTEFRFTGGEVTVRREGNAVVLEPIARKKWPKDFFRKIRIDDSAFARPKQGKLPSIPSL
jgi:virulence-associated protein VagC